ncbi:MAG TPA: aminotransferase class V-fold PLP-dependent enzyme [Rhodopila sp.]|uniref:aminotransferase class V-fold PLP-dependent enzyme n=1 Tax=Rhodopila sp. TaxID=2480087 RepID=UPI002C68E423|nr:aminotransferase class V-fold PLP-dependent enzyme [Rhodopila sp.]HVY16483.1 aminotransferase class V-fold PLP-dependent enzyme [Rhodopila sp.]
MTPLSNSRGNVRRHPDWDLDPDFLTVNHGSFGATPIAVRAAQRTWQDRMERQASRFVTTELGPALRKAAGVLADFLDARPEDVAFVDNATTGCNAVLRSMTFEAGDEIVVLSHVYGAVRNAVRHTAQATGARVVEARIPFPDPSPAAMIAAVAAILGAATRLVVLDHITSASALLVPVADIVRLAHAAGAKVLIDGAHAPGQIDLSLTDIGADWYVGNCHKWLCAPKGCAFLHARDQAALHPVVISHGYGQGFLAEFDWTGTTDFSRFLAVEEAIAHHRRLGGPALRARNRSLAAEAAERLARRLGTRTGGGPVVSAAMGTVRLPVGDPTPEHALAIRQALVRAGTDAPVHALDGGLWLRLSAFAYNEPGDYDRLGDIVAGVLAA